MIHPKDGDEIQEHLNDLVARGLIKAGWYVGGDTIHIMPMPPVDHITLTLHQTTQSTSRHKSIRRLLARLLGR